MRVIVCGSRRITREQYQLVFRELDKFHAETPITYLFHGAAYGVDSCAGNWGLLKAGTKVFPVPARWSKYGKSAGHVRNVQMVGQRPAMVIAFPGGKGTKDMIHVAKQLGIPVFQPLGDDWPA